MLDAIGDRWIGWSPDGRHLAVEVGQGEILQERWNIYIFTREGQGLRKLTSNERLAYHGQPDWSPDGNRIVYAAGNYWPDESGIVHTHLFIIDADGADQRQVTFGWNRYAYPAWSPDGTRIAYTIFYSYDRSDVYVMELATGKVTQVTHDGNSLLARWSPDGKQLVFVALPDGRKIGNIAVMNADGTGQRLLTDDAYDDWAPDWSPDGAHIAFDSIRSDNGSGIDIYTTNVDGSGLRQVTRDGRSRMPRWCPQVGDTNMAHAIYDRQAGELTLVTAGIVE